METKYWLKIHSGTCRDHLALIALQGLTIEEARKEAEHKLENRYGEELTDSLANGEELPIADIIEITEIEQFDVEKLAKQLEKEYELMFRQDEERKERLRLEQLQKKYGTPKNDGSAP